MTARVWRRGRGNVTRLERYRQERPIYQDNMKTSSNAQKAREARDLTRTHSEWLVYKEWEEIKKSLSEVGIRPGDPYYEKAYERWESWQPERDRH